MLHKQRAHRNKKLSQSRIASSTGLICKKASWLIMLTASRSLNLSALMGYLAGCATFDMARGMMTPCPSSSR